eukprot:NODE_537_length_6324_cov_1.677430.p2 type:complete len:379 gc:universal NODE_537_length_6324_cov_1.677430:1925-789(-)
MLQHSSSQQLIEFLNESKLQPKKSKSLFFKNKKQKPKKYQPLVVEPKKGNNLDPKNASVLTLLKREYLNSKSGSAGASLISTDSFVSMSSTTNTVDSSAPSSLKLPQFTELLSNSDKEKLDIVHKSTSSLEENSSSSEGPLGKIKSPKKNVQFSSVDIIATPKSSDSTLVRNRVDLFESITCSMESNTNIGDLWTINRSTQTEFQRTEEVENELSSVELREYIEVLKNEKLEIESRLHQLVDENGSQINENHLLKSRIDALEIQKQESFEGHSMLKADYENLQKTLLETRNNSQLSFKKTKELEKLSTKALKKIRELEGEKKFLNMQVEWLRSKMLQTTLNDDNDEISSISTSSSYNPQIAKWSQIDRSKEEGWETEV